MNLDSSPYDDSDSDKELFAHFEKQVKEGSPCFYDEDDYVVLFDHYIDSDDISLCEEVLNWADSQYPDSITITDCHARYLAAKGLYTEAEAVVDKALLIDSKDVDLLITKGKLLLLRHENRKADEIFDSLCDNHDDPFLYSTLVDIGNTYKQMKRKSKAIRIYERAIKLTDDNCEATFELALLYAENPEKSEETVALIEKVLDKNPYSTQAWLALGSVYNDIQKYEKAVEAFDYAYTIDPQCYKALFLKGQSLVNCSEYREALATFEEYADLEEEDSNLCLCIGECYEGLGHNDDTASNYQRTFYLGEAERKYRRAVNLDESNTRAMVRLAVLLIDEDPDEAVRWIHWAQKYDKSSAELWHLEGDIQCKLAIKFTAHKTEHIAWAEKSYKKAIELDPQNPLPMVSLGILFYDDGDYESALYYLEQAYRLSAEVNELSLFLALTYYQLNEKEQTKQFLKLAIEKDPEAWNAFTKICPSAKKDPILSMFRKKKNS